MFHSVINTYYNANEIDYSDACGYERVSHVVFIWFFLGKMITKQLNCSYVNTSYAIYVTSAWVIRTPQSVLQTSVGTDKLQWSLLSSTPIFLSGDHSPSGHPSK